MEYRYLGRTGLKVSETRAWARCTSAARPTRRRAARILDTFVDAGGTFIDTADVYSGRRVRGDPRPLAAAGATATTW